MSQKNHLEKPLGDIFAWGAIAGFSVPFGYVVGGPIRTPTMVTAACIGTMGGFMYAYQNSYGRLMGYNKP